MRRLLAGAALLLVPAVAHAAPSGSFTAVDYAFRANDTAATSLTIEPGQSVTFGYPSGESFHNVRFVEAKPACSGFPPGPRPPGWSGECTFDTPGTYPFVCDVHEEMKGRVLVFAPQPSATPTPTPDPTPPPPTPRQSTLTVKVAAKQSGSRVKGSLQVQDPGSKLEVTVRAGKRRVGTYTQKGTKSGTVTFTVKVALKQRKRLVVTVQVSLTPPDAKTLTKRTKVTLTRR